MKNDIQLKPCPFCGSKDVVLLQTQHKDLSNRKHFFDCRGCGASVFLYGKGKYQSAAQTEDEAYVLWNRRANLNEITLSQIYAEAVKVMKPEEIDHHGNGHGMDDLYLKVTPESTNLINRLTTRDFVSTFQSKIDGSKWYELPFCYPLRY